MAKERVHTVAIVGAGPRGTSVLERLLAHAGHLRNAGTPVRLHVDLIDPYPPGAGHVWRPDQSRLFLMNTPALFPTVSPGDLLEPAPVAGLTFDQWRERLKSGSLTGVELSEQDRDELAGLESTGFPSRALYGRYLRWIFAQLTAYPADDVTLSIHDAEAVSIAPDRLGGFGIELNAGQDLTADSVVLAMGHLPAELRPDQQALLTAAVKHGLRYWPPAVPADVDWSRLPADEPVLVRGLGLNFFDVMMQVTVGRGGQFIQSGDGPGRALDYKPSGSEPILYAASRRGTPYRAKAELQTYIPTSVKLRFCTAERAGRFAAAGVQPAFDHDLWPLLHRDALWAYYQTLARVTPSVFLQGSEEFLSHLDAILTEPILPGAEPWDHRVDRLTAEHVSPEHQLQIRKLAHPFARRTFASHREYDDAVLEYLEADARGSAAGEDDPLKMAIGALNAGRSVIKKIVADGGLTDASWLSELRGWFEAFVEGLASGPPAVRIEQLAALARAGVVHFLGPDPKFQVDEKTGLFSAGSPWVKAGGVTAAHMLEAMMPANHVQRNVSPLLSQMLEDGFARPKMMVSSEDAPMPGSGLDVTAPPYRLRMKNGHVNEGVYALGLQLSSVQWGTAIAAQADGDLESGARTLKDANDIASDIVHKVLDAEHSGPEAGIRGRVLADRQ